MEFNDYSNENRLNYSNENRLSIDTIIIDDQQRIKSKNDYYITNRQLLK